VLRCCAGSAPNCKGEDAMRARILHARPLDDARTAKTQRPADFRARHQAEAWIRSRGG
jgi:hypothetical protein